MLAVIKAFRNPKIPENYFRAEIYPLRFCGIELVKEESNLYKIYSYLSLFVWIYLFTFVELYEFYAKWGSDVDTMSNIFMNSVTHVNAALKVNIVFFGRHKFKRMIKILHEDPFKPDVNRGGNDELKHVRNCIKKTETMFIAFGVCIFSVYSASTFDSIMMFIVKPREEWHMTFMPISIVNTTYSPMFEIGFVYQHICIIMFCPYLLPADLLIVSVIAHLSCQFKILKCAFKNIRNRVTNMTESPEGRNKSYDECLRIVMRDSIKHHLRILDLAKEMEELCNFILLIIFFLSTVQLCFMLFQASLVPMGSVYFIKCLVYYVDISMQVFLYCFFIDEVTVESSDVSNAVMEMDWVGAPIDVQKSMIVIMARTLYPVQMTAGKFVTISLTAFMSLLRASFSYFTVLRQVNTE